MKKLLALALTALAAGSAFAQVGVSIGINEPGVYGRINIGEPPPPPALVQPRPIVIAPPRAGYAPPPPVYLYVPLAYQRDWRRYCGRYGACNQPVYFVRDEWVRERYVREHPDWGRSHPPGWDRGPHRVDHRGDDGHRDDHGDRGPRDRDDRRGPDRR